MPKRSKPLNLEEFDRIDWDDVEAEKSNLVKCMRRGIDQFVVAEVLETDWVSVIRPVETAEFVIVGPKKSATRCGPCSSPRPQGVATGSGP